MRAASIKNKKSFWITFIFIMAIFLILIGRLFYLQIIEGSQLQQKAVDQWTQTLPVTATRGRILDRDSQVLAQSGTTYMVTISPKSIKTANKVSVAEVLSEVLGLDRDKVLEKLNDESKASITLARQVDRDVIDKLEGYSLGSGVSVSLDVKRYYPLRTLLCQTIGFTTIDGEGQEGLELKYEKYLAGEDGSLVRETDGEGESIAYGVEEYIAPTDGYDVTLTIDSVVQSFLENALAEALDVNKAESAQGIVMNPKTGEILGMATKPDFDLNSPPRDNIELLNSLMRNRVVTDVYEPGSTFKIVTLSSGLDSGAITTGSTFYCSGSLTVDGEKIKCWSSRPHGSETLAEGVKNSCNPVFMQIALDMGLETFYDYIYAFGFGSSTESGVSGEARGIVTHQKYVRRVDLARIGFGQSIAVTPLQLITAASAAVNGGNLMRPYIVSSITDSEGNMISETEPQVVRRVISEQTSATVRDLLIGVVEDGSGRNAQIEGYKVGGKTGTAQKYEDGKIAEGKLVASFIGFAPADDPELICLIVVDEPKVGTIFGSTIAAPVAKQVLEQCLKYYGYKPTESTGTETVEVPPVIGKTSQEAKTALQAVGLVAEVDESGTGAVCAQMPAAGTTVTKGSSVLIYSSEITEEPAQKVEVPDLFGKSKLRAYDALKEAGLIMDEAALAAVGGSVESQSPSAGTMVEAGSVVTVRFKSD